MVWLLHSVEEPVLEPISVEETWDGMVLWEEEALPAIDSIPDDREASDEQSRAISESCYRRGLQTRFHEDIIVFIKADGSDSIHRTTTAKLGGVLMDYLESR